MFKMRKVGNIKYLILGMLISGIMFGTGAYAVIVISANNISYVDNANLGADNVQAAIDGTCIKFSNQLTNLKNEVKEETLNEMYPVGSIYISTSISTSSALAKTLGIGTWESYASGRTLVGVGTGIDKENTSQTFKNNETGGEYKHKLTITEMPSHNHKPQLDGVGFATYGSNGGNSNWEYDGNNMLFGGTNVTGNTGGDGAHNNIQPYIAVYMYKRIS